MRSTLLNTKEVMSKSEINANDKSNKMEVRRPTL